MVGYASKPSGPEDLSRRALLRGTAAVALAGSAAACGERTTISPTTFVLVHGAWHGGWCWQRVVDLLVRQGHTVHAPTLTGLCERSHLLSPDIDLSTHVADVVNEVLWKDLDRVVLCGHSYGGMVISGAAEQLAERIASIVYLDAFVPEDGQSLYDILGAEQPALDAYLVAPITAEQFNVNEADRAWVNSKMTQQPVACFTERLTLSGAAQRVAKKTYIRATVGASPQFQAAFERLSADRSWTTHAVDCGHDVMLDKPAELAELLVAAA
jgi:pimeloyl-ACP methyl ester carboxylesterase